ncbi:MAG: sigma-70 family RNA polymerase sigma factor [Cyclobacteriaceae bacterium]|nr:sigma-70 family RNA polymerase sigma factor [Cyclobacteriaceae bacterium]
MIHDPDKKNSGFNLLVKKYQSKIYWVIRKMVIDHDDADDLVQEVFVKTWLKIDTFREESALYTWLYKIATNETLNFLRKKRRRFFIPIQDIEKELSEKLISSDLVSADDPEIKLQQALLKLPDKQRLVFNLKYYEDLKYEEIAEITGSSVGTLKANYHHAVKKIELFFKAD